MTSSLSEESNSLCAIFLLLLTLYVAEGFSTFDCHQVCYGRYSSLPDSQKTCDILLEVQSCHQSNMQACSTGNPQFLINFYRHDVERRVNQMSCIRVTTPLETTGPQPTQGVAPSPCPVILQQVSNDVEEARVYPNPLPIDQCKIQPPPLRFQHCSLFADSHLRPFNAYSSSIQTCSLPGAWFLFHHPRLQIEVEGITDEMGSRHTLLSKVKVIVNASGTCNPERRLYVAVNNMPLPDTFTEADNGNTSLQLHVDDSGTVASILAPWINSTIIIRRISGFLSVSLQVTGHLAFESEGLCTGCPRHQYIDSLSANVELNKRCKESHTNAVIQCFSVQRGLLDVTNISYSDACIYSMLQSPTSHSQKMMQAIADDARLLPNVGFVPTRLPPHIINAINTPIRITTPTSETTPTPAESSTAGSREVSRTMSSPSGSIGRRNNVTSSTNNYFVTSSAGHHSITLHMLSIVLFVYSCLSLSA